MQRSGEYCATALLPSEPTKMANHGTLDLFRPSARHEHPQEEVLLLRYFKKYNTHSTADASRSSSLMPSMRKTPNKFHVRTISSSRSSIKIPSTLALPAVILAFTTRLSITNHAIVVMMVQQVGWLSPVLRHHQTTAARATFPCCSKS